MSKPQSLKCHLTDISMMIGAECKWNMNNICLYDGLRRCVFPKVVLRSLALDMVS